MTRTAIRSGGESRALGDARELDAALNCILRVVPGAFAAGSRSILLFRYALFPVDLFALPGRERFLTASPLLDRSSCQTALAQLQ